MCIQCVPWVRRGDKVVIRGACEVGILFFSLLFLSTCHIWGLGPQTTPRRGSSNRTLGTDRSQGPPHMNVPLHFLSESHH